jgi:hypothetical protein
MAARFRNFFDLGSALRARLGNLSNLFFSCFFFLSSSILVLLIVLSTRLSVMPWPLMRVTHLVVALNAYHMWITIAFIMDLAGRTSFSHAPTKFGNTFHHALKIESVVSV